MLTLKNICFAIFFCMFIVTAEALEKAPRKTRAELDKAMTKLVSKSFKSWQIAGKFYMFVINSSKVLTVTSKCGDEIPDKTKKPGCMALQKLNDVSLNDLNTLDLQGGKNPGSVLCKKSAKGLVVFGKDHQGNLSSFCAFADGSMVASDTLHYYGTINAKK